MERAIDGDRPAAYRAARRAVVLDPSCVWFTSSIAAHPEVELVAPAVQLQIRMGVSFMTGGARASQMLREWRHSLASNLLRRVAEQFEKGKLSEALVSINEIHDKGLDNAEVRTYQARCHSKMGQLEQCVSALSVALRYDPGNQQLRTGLMRAYATLGDHTRLASEICGETVGREFFATTKIRFYALAEMARLLAEHEAASHVAEMARAIFTCAEARDRLSAALDANEVSLTWVIDRLTKDAATDRLAQAMARRDTDAWLEELSNIVTDDAACPEVLNEVVPIGPDAGHPVWHVVNPFFQLWSGAEVVSHSEANWTENSSIKAGLSVSQVISEYDQWRETADPARSMLLDRLGQLGQRAKVLDLGCGRGEWLRFMYEEGEISLRQLYGVELHASRAELARALITDGIDGDRETANGFQTDQIMVGDLLNLDTQAILSRMGGDVDLITLFVVTGCFGDQNLESLLKSVAELGASFIMTTTVGKSWDLWTGREDEDAYFLRVGYVPMHQEWTPELIDRGSLSNLLLPRKYWVNRRASIYRRADSSL